jgi:hypothetical protein
MGKKIKLIRLFSGTLLAFALGFGYTALNPATLAAAGGCPPDEESCVEGMGAWWSGNCWGSYCYSEREHCCFKQI